MGLDEHLSPKRMTTGSILWRMFIENLGRMIKGAYTTLRSRSREDV